ncbi:hypothetical protein H5410_001943, partial [Solanum commersonii]
VWVMTLAVTVTIIAQDNEFFFSQSGRALSICVERHKCSSTSGLLDISVITTCFFFVWMDV